jgi:hypothetical protein
MKHRRPSLGWGSGQACCGFATCIPPLLLLLLLLLRLLALFLHISQVAAPALARS